MKAGSQQQNQLRDLLFGSGLLTVPRASEAAERNVRRRLSAIVEQPLDNEAVVNEEEALEQQQNDPQQPQEQEELVLEPPVFDDFDMPAPPDMTLDQSTIINQTVTIDAMNLYMFVDRWMTKI